MGTFRVFAFLVFCIWLGCGPAHADRRIALVIGNSNYQRVAKLPNPANDAGAVAAMLQAAGFDSVDAHLDVTANELRKALRDFAAKAREAEVAVVYYAGHGIELEGVNYLIPVDAVLETDGDVLDETVSLDRVLFAVEPAKQLRLVILDACRDNPFARTMKRTIAFRAVGRGLAKVDPTSPNTLIAFAARAGSTASDGDNGGSPFTAALVEHLPKPGLDLRKAFGFVRDDVLKKTGFKQEPYVYGSLGGNDVPLVPAKPTATVPQADPQAAVRRDYELALQLGTRDGWRAFLSQYPDGFYANLAKGQINKIAAEEARAAAAETARVAEQEKARLVAARAEKAEQERAAAAVKAAEEARIAAETAKQTEQVKVEAAERARAEAESLAAQKAAAEKVAAEKAASEVATNDAAGKKTKEEKLAALPPVEKSDPATAIDLPRALQAELRRVGCSTGAVDGNWDATAQKALELFNKSTGMKLDVKMASADALDAVKSKTGRICPLICEHGFRADGDRCTRITCRSGYELSEGNTCEKIAKKPVAAREEAKQPRAKEDRAKLEAPQSKPQASGQIYCGQQGCRPVQRGCHIETNASAGPLNTPTAGAGGLREVCN